MNINALILVTIFKFGTIAYIKITLLILIALYVIFTFMLATKVRSMNRSVFLPPESGELLFRLFSIVYFLVALSLFFATLVIV